MRRAIVIGCPGSGKSVFSRALRDKTGLPLTHLDMLYWNGDRTIVDKPLFRARLQQALEGERWIIDGNYASTMEQRLQACDTVFLLDYPAEVCVAGIKARMGTPRADMLWVETEEDGEFMEYVRSFREGHRPQIFELLARYPDKTVYIFQSREEADGFLDGLTDGPVSGK